MERTVPGTEVNGKPTWRVRQASGNVFTCRELTTLQRWIVERKVARDDEISADGERWKRLGNIAELASFFQVVEEAQRSRSSPALTPLPMPPVLYVPTPPRGVPPPAPPAFAAPPPDPAWLPPTLGGTGTLGAPVEHEVDLGLDLDGPPPARPAARRWPFVAAIVAAAGASAVAGALAVPHLFPADPPPVPPPPRPPAAVQPAVQAVAPPPPPAPAVAAPPAAPPTPAPAEPAAKPKPPPTPKALLERARKLLGSGNAEAALDLFGRVASEDPSNAEALSGRGLCYLDLEKWAPAEESFRSALRAAPDQPEAMLGLAETYRFQGKKAEATSQYERYLARHPDGEEAEVAKNALIELRK
jgi:hypothetical protein